MFEVTVACPPLGSGMVEGPIVGVPQETGAVDVAVNETLAALPPVIAETVTVVVADPPGYPFVGFGEDVKTKIP
jgi:hypothetical protein